MRFAEQLEKAVFVATEYGLPLDATEREVRSFFASRKRSEIRAECGASKKKRKRPEGHGLLESHSMEEAARCAALLSEEVRSWRGA